LTLDKSSNPSKHVANWAIFQFLSIWSRLAYIWYSSYLLGNAILLSGRENKSFENKSTVYTKTLIYWQQLKDKKHL